MKTLRVQSFFPLLIASILFLLPSCWPWSAQDKHTGIVVINVLDKDLYDDCHIKGSINVTIDRIERYAQQKIYKNAVVVLYCSNYMCSTSGFSRGKLIALGFKNALVYEGGTAEWYQLGYPTEGPAKSPYLKKVLTAPEKQEHYVISAQELKKKIDEHEAQKS